MQGGLNEPDQASPVFALVMVGVGIFLAFVVLSAIFSPGGDSFARHPLTDLRLVLAHPICFLRGGLKGSILCAAKSIARRQKSAEVSGVDGLFAWD